jgi:hypothetical protein
MLAHRARAPESTSRQRHSSESAGLERGGTVRETSTNGAYTDFTVWPTNPQGGNITGNDQNGNAWPQTRTNVRRDQFVDFNVPAGQIGGQNVADWRQRSRIHSTPTNAPGGAVELGTNWLDIESIFHDTNTNTYYVDGVFDLISAVYGNNVFVHIPDLFADTNGSGGLDDNDVLYSLVDMRVFCANAPGFNDNDLFQIVNGQVPALPGMRFSTTPFTFSPSSGFDNGTPFSGNGEVLSYHSLSSVPEPLSAAASLCALLPLLMRRKRD